MELLDCWIKIKISEDVARLRSAHFKWKIKDVASLRSKMKKSRNPEKIGSEDERRETRGNKGQDHKEVERGRRNQDPKKGWKRIRSNQRIK
jgi:hypothetical protein